MERNKVQEVVRAIDEALKALGVAQGFTLGKQSARYDAAGLRLTVQLQWTGAMGDGEREAFVRDAQGLSFMGWRPEWYGRTFKVGFREYRLVGIEPRSRKWGAVCEREGKRYKLAARDVVHILAGIDAARTAAQAVGQ